MMTRNQIYDGARRSSLIVLIAAASTWLIRSHFLRAQDHHRVFLHASAIYPGDEVRSRGSKSAASMRSIPKAPNPR